MCRNVCAYSIKARATMKRQFMFNILEMDRRKEQSASLLFIVQKREVLFRFLFRWFSGTNDRILLVAVCLSTNFCDVERKDQSEASVESLP